MQSNEEFKSMSPDMSMEDMAETKGEATPESLQPEVESSLEDTFGEQIDSEEHNQNDGMTSEGENLPPEQLIQ